MERLRIEFVFYIVGIKDDFYVFQVAQSRSVICLHTVGGESRDCHGNEDGNNSDDNHEFNEGETLAFQNPRQFGFPLPKKSLLRELYKVRPAGVK